MCSQKSRERKDGRERDMLKFDIEGVRVESSRTERFHEMGRGRPVLENRT